MLSRRPRLAAALLVLALPAAPRVARAQPQVAPPSAVLAALQGELARSMATFRSQPTPPYFIAYAVTERRSAGARASFGALTGVEEQRGRGAHVDVRVGTPAFDNTHRGADGPMSFFGDFSMVTLPLEDDAPAIRHALWRETDRRYKRAVAQLMRAKAAAPLRVAPEDTSPDFSPAPPARHRAATPVPRWDREDWSRRVRAWSAPFARQDDLYEGTAELTVDATSRWYVNSDGAELETGSTYYRLTLSAVARADDGMLLPRFESFVATSPEGLPDDSTVLATVARMLRDLQALRKAPVLGATTAPAIFSGRASGVFFHEVLGHRIEGHRLKDEDDAQTFVGKVGERLLPAGFSVTFDPTLRRMGSTELVGAYEYDDEGVAAERVDAIVDGVLRTFLLSRSPIAGFARSNGHGRGFPGLGAVARQSNLIVRAAKPVSRTELKRRLLAEVKRQGKPFGLLFDDIEGGFTMTSRWEPNAFEVIPVMVYRVWPDGREELVRGVDVIGTPLDAFSRILAADDQVQVFNGVCGAESGPVPVSASSPAILVSSVEVQRKEKSQEQAPLLPPPSREGR